MLNDFLKSILRIRLINIDQAVTIFGRQFSEEGFHPIVQTIKEYQNNEKISVENTSLYRYHNEFTPEDMCQAFGRESSMCDLPLFVFPWGRFRLGCNKLKDPLKSRFCGPTELDRIQKEFLDSINLYLDIKNNGYQIIRRRSVIGGTFIINKNLDKRFIVLQGNHRMSALTALGHKKVLVYTMPGYLNKIDENKIDSWEEVRRGNCSKNLALEIFRLFFNAESNSIY